LLAISRSNRLWLQSRFYLAPVLSSPIIFDSANLNLENFKRSPIGKCSNMLISKKPQTVHRSRAPLRLGLAGGGTDLSPYSDLFGGVILNATVDRYAIASLSYRTDDQVILRANDLDVEESHKPGLLTGGRGLRLHQAVYNRIVKQFLIDPPAIELSTSIEAPAGSGLGSSSALVVAMVEVYREAFNLPLGLYDVAHLAFEIERVDLALDGGKQDQYAAAFGGINFMEFLSNDRVIVNPLRVSREILNELESSIVICFTGQSRDSDVIIRDQIRAAEDHDSRALEGLHALKRDAYSMKQFLLNGDINGMAEIMNQSWESKKATAASVSNSHLDALYSVGRSNGARGGKVSGAGGGGFMMFIADPEKKPLLIRALLAAGGTPDKVILTHTGVESWIVQI
jgi:D-glycero-alpha-D-manno-heptose-7-phosphate kinase